MARIQGLSLVIAMELPRAPDGGLDWDQWIGSILERWLTTNLPGRCRFCRKPVTTEDPTVMFCSIECKKNWELVQAARIAIGKRDLKQRGYD